MGILDHKTFLVEKSFLEQYANIRDDSQFGTTTWAISAHFSYLTDKGKEKKFEAVFVATKFRDYHLLLSSKIPEQPGIKAYGSTWHDIVYTNIKRKSAQKDHRMFQEGKSTKILYGLDHKHQLQFVTLHCPEDSDVERLLRYEDSNAEYLEYGGTVYANCDSWGELENSITAEEIIRDILNSELRSNVSGLEYLVTADGTVYSKTCVLSDLRFIFDSTNDGQYGHLKVEPVQTECEPWRSCKTFEEISICFEGIENKNELRRQFSHIHQKLMGKPIPIFKQNDFALVQNGIKDKEKLNDLVGVVERVQQNMVAVKFLNYFVEEFRITELEHPEI